MLPDGQFDQADAYAVYREMKTLSASRGRGRPAYPACHIVRILGSSRGRGPTSHCPSMHSAEPEDADRVGQRFTGHRATRANMFETWHEDRCCDGFNILQAVLPNDLTSLRAT